MKGRLYQIRHFSVEYLLLHIISRRNNFVSFLVISGGEYIYIMYIVYDMQYGTCTINIFKHLSINIIVILP